jgi:hypothetical protein
MGEDERKIFVKNKDIYIRRTVETFHGSFFVRYARRATTVPARAGIRRAGVRTKRKSHISAAQRGKKFMKKCSS